MPPEPENFWYRSRDMINLFNIGIKNSSKNEKKNQSNYLGSLLKDNNK